MSEVCWHGTDLRLIGQGDDPLIPDTDMAVLAVTIDRPLTDKQADLLAGLTGYVWRSVLNGHRLVYDHHPAQPDLIVFDGVAGPRRSDPVAAWSRFLDVLADTVVAGTPVRATDRAGAGTKGTRLLNGFGPDADLRVYADSAVPESSAAFLQAMSGIATRI